MFVLQEMNASEKNWKLGLNKMENNTVKYSRFSEYVTDLFKWQQCKIKHAKNFQW